MPRVAHLFLAAAAVADDVLQEGGPFARSRLAVERVTVLFCSNDDVRDTTRHARGWLLGSQPRQRQDVTTPSVGRRA